jgi:hypothetical protein
MVQAFWVVRCIVLRAGALTGQGEGVFFLSIEEILVPGEILVGSVTNVGWTPLFPRLACTR